MKSVDFLLLCEGSSDQNLVDIIRALLLQAGCDRVSGDSHFGGGSVEQKVRKALTQGSSFDVLFVHRDSDSRDPEPRYREVATQVRSGGWESDFVCVVPVQSTETWLLADQQSIRNVVGKPSGKISLELPKVTAIEDIGRPKERLSKALLDAAQATGRRYESEKKRFNERRQTLLSRLSLHGPVSQLQSFQRLQRDVESFYSSKFPDPGEDH